MPRQPIPIKLSKARDSSWFSRSVANCTQNPGELQCVKPMLFEVADFRKWAAATTATILTLDA
jgi:hypothetical protein